MRGTSELKLTCSQIVMNKLTRETLDRWKTWTKVTGGDRVMGGSGDSGTFLDKGHTLAQDVFTIPQMVELQEDRAWDEEGKASTQLTYRMRKLLQGHITDGEAWQVKVVSALDKFVVYMSQEVFTLAGYIDLQLETVINRNAWVGTHRWKSVHDQVLWKVGSSFDEHDNVSAVWKTKKFEIRCRWSEGRPNFSSHLSLMYWSVPRQ